jgi:hypothetical protein
LYTLGGEESAVAPANVQEIVVDSEAEGEVAEEEKFSEDSQLAEEGEEEEYDEGEEIEVEEGKRARKRTQTNGTEWD